MDTPGSIHQMNGLEAMTTGAPRSAREALQSGAISLEALRAAHQMPDPGAGVIAGERVGE